jgi:hypothetical protein
MAHAHTSQYATPVTVTAKDFSEVWVECGPFSFRLTREEAAQLAADLLNAVEATPVEQEAAA